MPCRREPPAARRWTPFSTPGPLRLPYIQVFVANAPVPTSSYARTRIVLGSRTPGFVDPASVREFLAGGATVMLPRLDHWYPPVIDLARALSTRTRRRVDAFAFYTPPRQQGLAIHRDDADVVLLQTAGSKIWTIYARPADGNWDAGAVAEPGQPVFETELSAGEALYIPRGSAHVGIGGGGTGSGAMSAHLSFVIAQIGTSEMRHAVQQLVSTTAAELAPRPVDEPALTVTAARLLERLRQQLDELTSDQLVELAQEVPFINLRRELGLADS